TPLAPPSAPTLSPLTPGNGNVTLAWTPPSSNGGMSITSYRVYRSTSTGTEPLLTTLGNVTGFTDTGLTNGGPSSTKGTAANAIGEGAKSNEMNTTPATVPGAPTLNAAVAGPTSVTLGWSAPGSNGGSAITNYRIYRSTSSGAETLLTTLGNVTGFTDSGL